jgi:exosome complex exonuclease DIS3/RRP44
MSEITSGLHRGIYHQGKLRVNRYNPFEAYVGSESIGDEIIIYGRSDMNRAFDGDIVAVELLPQDEWQGEKSMSIAGEGILPKLSVFCQKEDLQLVKIYSFEVISKAN